MSKTPIYLVAPEESMRSRCLSAFPEPVVVEGLHEVGPSTSRPPGLVLAVAGSLDLGEAMDAAARFSAEPGWTLGVLTFDPAGEPWVSTLSVGRRHSAADVHRFASGAPEPGDMMDLNRVLRELSKVRHDLNNHLTTALAEVQILLMDAEPGVADGSLLVIQEQLRRMRDVLLKTRHLRPVGPATL